jgi:hypothetical protein
VISLRSAARRIHKGPKLDAIKSSHCHKKFIFDADACIDCDLCEAAIADARLM